MDSVVSDSLVTLFEWNPQVLTAVCAKAMEAQSAALAAKAARDMVRLQSYYDLDLNENTNKIENENWSLE